MNALAKEAFQTLKPACIALSNTTLAPDYGVGSPLPQPLSQLDALIDATNKTSPVLVPQSVGNYVFMPIKPLLVAQAPEAVLERVFALLAWLMQTEWFVQAEDMVAQLLMLHSTFLARAKSDELKLQITKAIAVLFDHAGEKVNVLKARPTLAHLTTSLLAESPDLALQQQSLQALLTLYQQLEPETGASFLPGTVSSLSRKLTKQGQKSTILVASLQLLRLGITRSLSGDVYDGYRAGKWFEATASQIHLAVTPILAHLLKSDHEAVLIAACKFCKAMLQTKLKPVRYIEFLLQVEPDALSNAQHDAIAEVVGTYIEGIPRVLQSADEDRKCNILKALTCASAKLQPASRALLSDQLLHAILEFAKFSSGSQLVRSADVDEPPAAPRILHMSSEAQDCLCTLLAALEPTFEVPLETPEGFYIAQQLGQSTLAHAMSHLSEQPELSQLAILRRARQDGPLFKPHLRYVLFPLLAQRHPNRYVLDETARLCLYDDTAAMIVDQADYIVNSLSLAFATLDLTASTPRMLGLLCQLAPRMVELVDDVVEAYFDVLDAYHGHQGMVSSIFDGLQGVVSATARQLSEPDSFVKAIDATPRKDDEEEEEAATVSSAYMLVLKICRKAQLFLSHGEPQVRMSLLALLEEAMPVLATNEDLFLPFVHLVWPPLCHLLDDPQAYVVANAYRLVAKLITYSGTFMRRRVTEDVLWRIQEVLTPPKDKRGNLLYSKAYSAITLVSLTEQKMPEDNIRAAVIGDARSRRGIQAAGQEVGIGPAGYRKWQGTARRKVAEGIEASLAAIVRDAGLQPTELASVMETVKKLSERSTLLKRVIAEQAANRS
jgi:hypothetical protein